MVAVTDIQAQAGQLQVGAETLGFWREGPAAAPRGWIMLPRGDASRAGTLEYWIARDAPWVPVVLRAAYEPAQVDRFPVRGGLRAGEAAAFPDIEADALVAAGIATYA